MSAKSTGLRNGSGSEAEASFWKFEHCCVLVLLYVISFVCTQHARVGDMGSGDTREVFLKTFVCVTKGTS